MLIICQKSCFVIPQPNWNYQYIYPWYFTTNFFMENYRPFENQILILFDANIRLVTDFQSKAKIFNCLYIRDIEVNHCGKINYGVTSPSYQNRLPYSHNHNPLLIKNFSWIQFIYSEKATKFCEIFPLLLTTVHSQLHTLLNHYTT